MRESLYSSLCKSLQPSEIGALMSAARSPEIISLAAGVPAAEFFPLQELAFCSQEVLLKDGMDVLQYGDQQGNEELRLLLMKRMKQVFSINTKMEHIHITTGSQQGLDICARLYLDRDDEFLVEMPTYVDAINTLSFTGAKAIGIPLIEDGLDLNALKKQLEQNNKIKLIYVIPDFQNPTGQSWSLKTRQKFMEIIHDYNLIVIEDNPYGEIKYTEKSYPTLKSMDTQNKVIFLGTFSKILSPGMRVGWFVAGENHSRAINLVKERCDIHTSALDQAIIAHYLNHYSLDAHISGLCSVYKQRRNIMLSAIDEVLPQCNYIKPEGGIFLWLKLPEEINCLDLFYKALEKRVAVVPGTPFFVNKDKYSYIRLNFSSTTNEEIKEGLIRLKEAMENIDNV